jgi:hypothetical protein
MIREPSRLTETLACIHDDPKRQRIRSQPKPYLCPVCQRWVPARTQQHAYDCANATIEDVRRECERALQHEKWAREKAERYLLELRRMHATVAAVKHELKKLRARK